MQRTAEIVIYSLKIFVTLAAGLTGNQWRGEVFEENKLNKSTQRKLSNIRV
jgi:hypothetical protein